LDRRYDATVSWSEASLHRYSRVLLGSASASERVGNDAAVLRAPLARPVVCVDQTIEGVHFEAGTSAARAGRKACARALSDLAASAAEPRAVLLALRAPREANEAYLRGLIHAVAATAKHFGAALVGGDTSCARGPLAMSVTAIGSLPASFRPVSRDRARPGQVVVASGPFGGSSLGRHLAIEPRFAAGRWLVELGATAMMDVSDGLALDLSRIAALSNVRIDLGTVPIHRDARRMARRSGRSAHEHALCDGEDHELVATLPLFELTRALRMAPRYCPGLVVLGRVRAGRGLFVARDEGSDELVRWNGRGGWLHGG
jgi:thiamine-monophosphate kinase